MVRPIRPPSRISSAALLGAGLACLVALAAVGCGGDHNVAPVVVSKLPVNTPENTSPDSTVQRLMTAYQYMAPAEYDTLLTSDFHYHFSAQTDPVLVSMFGATMWGKVDEAQSFTHLVHGFTNGQGIYAPPAISITAALANDVVGDDTSHTDSTAWYRAVNVSVLSIDIDVPTSGGSAVYNIRMPITFLLVRGDAAVLSAGQAHSASRWYIREMDDLSAPLASKFPQTMPAQASTWGAVRATYR